MFFMMLLGLVIFAAVVYVFMAGNKSSELASAPIFFVLPSIIMTAMVGAAWMINQRMKARIKPEMHVQVKLRHYQQRVLLRLVLIETGVLAAGAFAMISKSPNLYLLMLAGMGVFAYFRPGSAEFLQDYPISQEDKEKVA